MLNLQDTSTTMKLVPLVCLCLVTRSGRTFADGNGPVVVKEDSDVVLPCSLSSKENLESKLFDWKKDQNMEVFIYDAGTIYGNKQTERTGQDQQFKGRVSHFPDELKKGNASIKITKTKVSDSGTYTCIFPRPQPSQTFSVQLVVGACPKPSARSIVETKDWSLLQCAVRGASPKPVVVWRDSSNNTLQSEEPQVTERGGKYDINLQTTVTKTDNYTCVVTQDEICHRDDIRVSVYISGAALTPIVTSRQTENGLLLKCEVHGASSGTKVEWRDSSGTISAEKPEFTQTGSSYDIILQTTVTKADAYTCEVTTETGQKYSTQIVHSKGPAAGSSGTPFGWIIGSFLLGALLVVLGVLVRCLYKKQKKSRKAGKSDQRTCSKESPFTGNNQERGGDLKDPSVI